MVLSKQKTGSLCYVLAYFNTVAIKVPIGLGYNLNFLFSSCAYSELRPTVKEDKCLLNLTLAQHMGKKGLGNSST